MPTPATAIAVIGQTKTGRKIALGALTLLLVLSAFAMTPLVAIPFAIAGTSVMVGSDTPQAAPVVDGAWGYPLAGDVQLRSRVRLQPGRGLRLLLNKPQGLRHGTGVRGDDLCGGPRAR